ncbi:MAG: glycosyltransferase family 10 domain-containing protein [Cetobacterium sp.]|uniref:glycosyltransferase family 10 domain-containing protein n=1 Tax=Cetobacterium sp. TaxID=2071632 RepID=UPI003F2BC1E5
MRIGLVPAHKGLQNNRIFNIDDKNLNRDDILMPYYLIKEELKKNEIFIDTIDYYKKVEIVVYFSRSYSILLKNRKNINIYFAWEPEVVDKNHSKEGLKKLESFFDYIMTWNDGLVDNKKYFKINYPYYFPQKKSFSKEFKEKKLIVNISGNKKSFDKRELYSERVKVINYFEENNSNDFDLYGIGWDFSLKTYRGKTESKFETYSNYKFALCLENMKDVEGYITEKIFDCFVSGIVPIYKGASNIQKYIPENCYIKYDNFKTIDQMESFLKNISESEYNQYLKNIEEYLKGNKKEVFEARYFVDQLLKLNLQNKKVYPSLIKVNLKILKEKMKYIYRKKNESN